jgi:hypothetical protein
MARKRSPENVEVARAEREGKRWREAYENECKCLEVAKKSWFSERANLISELAELQSYDLRSLNMEVTRLTDANSQQLGLINDLQALVDLRKVEINRLMSLSQQRYEDGVREAIYTTMRGIADGARGVFSREAGAGRADARAASDDTADVRGDGSSRR